MARIVGIALALALACSSAALGADEALLDAPEVSISPEAVSTSVYLRGDAGYAAFRSDGAPDLLSGGDARGFDDDRFGRPVSGSLGLGYRLTDILRADVTADIFDGRFTGTDTAAGVATDYRADLRAIGVMGNAYVDLATIAGFTPYLGAGLGATHLDWRAVSARPVNGGPMPGPDAYEGQDGWRFTYAFMAGASYDLSERLKLDIGYRYSDIAGGDMFAGNGDTGRDDGLSRHEVRAGLRFSLY